jgi:ubiquinone/menaquinone biosynthesis C-methylase UbiE
MNPLYDSIGTNYKAHRKADLRIVSALCEALNLGYGDIVADIGAGTGNYSNALADKGFVVKAIEPSGEMHSQSVFHPNVEWFSGVAEHIPLADDSVSGITAILALHHFSSVTDATFEFARICPKGPVVVFTFDPRESEDFWLAEYFPLILKDAFRIFPPVADVAENLARRRKTSSVIPFRLPSDLTDLFLAAGWSRPQMYLDPAIRQSMSGFAIADQSIVRSGVDRLAQDLSTGTWDTKFGKIRSRKTFDAGYRIIVVR